MCEILVDAQRREIPHAHRSIDISLYDREVIADSVKFLYKLNSAVKSKGYLTRGKKENCDFILLTKYYTN